MQSIKLQWKQFNVDLEAIEAKFRAEHASYKGNQSTPVDLELYFDEDIYAVPMHDVVHQEERQAVDEETGELLFDENNDPIMETVDVTVSEPTGEPSKAQAIQAYWDAIDAQSSEATGYIQKAQKAVVKAQVAAAIEFGRRMIEDFATENVMMGITADNKTEEVLDIATPMMNALQSGSLTVAIKRAKAIPEQDYDVKYITAARLLSYVNKMEAFMGLPLSNSL